jgi:hypothetical protein
VERSEGTGIGEGKCAPPSEGGNLINGVIVGLRRFVKAVAVVAILLEKAKTKGHNRAEKVGPQRPNNYYIIRQPTSFLWEF